MAPRSAISASRLCGSVTCRITSAGATGSRAAGVIAVSLLFPRNRPERGPRYDTLRRGRRVGLLLVRLPGLGLDGLRGEHPDLHLGLDVPVQVHGDLVGADLLDGL